MKDSVKFGEGFGKDWRKQSGGVYDVGHGGWVTFILREVRQRLAASAGVTACK